MGNIGVATLSTAPSKDDVRMALNASADLEALRRMARTWQVRSDGVRVTGKRGPKLCPR